MDHAAILYASLREEFDVANDSEDGSGLAGSSDPGDFESLLASPKRVAKLLDVGMTTVYSLAAKGHLESVWLGKSRRFTMESVRRCAGLGTSPPKSQRPRLMLGGVV
jgi:excisionase family DNA binding protein